MAAESGDPALATRLRDLLGVRHPVAATATVGQHGVVTASLGADLDADYEIASVSKGVTGLLYADAVQRGEVSPDGRLGGYLPLGACPASLVRDRLAVPLGLDGLYVPATPGELSPTALSGRSRHGRPRAPWTGEALAPAGGVRAPVTAMAGLAAALLDGRAPGTAALDPATRFSGRAVRIGAAWITLRVQGREVTWHNGATGGFRSWLGLDRAASTGVVLLSATAAALDAYGFRLLFELADAGST